MDRNLAVVPTTTIIPRAAHNSDKGCSLSLDRLAQTPKWQATESPPRDCVILARVDQTLHLRAPLHATLSVSAPAKIELGSLGLLLEGLCAYNTALPFGQTLRNKRVSVKDQPLAI